MIAKRDDWPKMSDSEKVDYLYVQSVEIDRQFAEVLEDLRRQVRLLTDEVAHLRGRLDQEAGATPRRHEG